MEQRIRAVYNEGQLHLLDTVQLVDGDVVEVAILSQSQDLDHPRILGLHPGSIITSDDFDDPLPDEFWFGNE